MAFRMEVSAKRYGTLTRAVPPPPPPAEAKGEEDIGDIEAEPVVAHNAPPRQAPYALPAKGSFAMAAPRLRSKAGLLDMS